MIRNVLDWLEQTAARVPMKIAFEDEGEGMTYGGLLSRAREIGACLARAVRPQNPVLILMDKSPACVAAMLGAVYAGCFYTPADPAMPVARLTLIADALRPACVICGEKYRALAGNIAGNAPVFSYNEIPHAADDGALARIRQQHIDTDLLYVLFTSGSTGVPKGVAIAHRSVVDLVEWAVGALGIDEDCVFGNQAPLYFDNSVLDIYCAMATGARVHFIPNKHFLFPATIPAYLTAHGINTIFWVPSALTMTARTEALASDPPRGVRNVFFCGEVMPCRTLNLWRAALPGAKFVNLYGPTEITDVCAYYVVDREFKDGDALPIGRACANTRIYLIDGELCVAGVCLSPGYYRAPEKTAAAFVLNPLKPESGEIIYKTGDLSEYNARGELMFLGRKDSQIKRHGNRIELGEIECALCAAQSVAAGACLYDAARETIICFYAGDADEKAVKRELKAHLPKYMLPDVFLRRDALPRTGNGKIDRALLMKEWEHEHPVL